MANIFVDITFMGTEDGTATNPWNTLAEAMTQANFFPDSETVNVYVQDGTYAENLVIDRGNLNFIASNPAMAIIAPASGTAVSLSGDLNLAGPSFFSMDGFVLSGGSTGVNVASSTLLDSLTLDNMTINGSAQTGVNINDVPGLGSVSITNSTFTDAGSGAGNSNGSGAIVLFDFHADATLADIDITNTDTSMTPDADLPDNAIQISGFDQTTYDVAHPIGNVSLSDISISGYYHKPALTIQGFTNLSTLSFTNIDIDATVNGFGGLLVFIDPIASSGQAAPGTAGYPGNFAGSGGTNTLDLSGINIVGNGNMAAEYDVFVRGTDADDIYTGTNGRDILNARAETDFDYGGDDTLNGMGGDDLLFGGLGTDTLDGGTGIDTAQFAGTFDGYAITVTLDADGRVASFDSVTDSDAMNGDEGTDGLTDIERLAFSDGGMGQIVFSADDPVHAFNSDGTLAGTFTTIQEGVDAVDTGGRVNVDGGTYVENITVTTAMTIEGHVSMYAGESVSSTVIAPASGAAIAISGALGAMEDVNLDDLDIVSGSFGVQVASGTVLGNLNIDNVNISDTVQNGVILNDADGVGNVSITNSVFTDAGAGPGGSNGSGAIVLFDYHNDATIMNVDIVSTSLITDPSDELADNAIQIAGFDQTTYDVSQTIGDVTIENVNITGVYQKPAISIQGFTNLSTLDFTNVTIDATVTTFGGLLVFIDPIASSGQAAIGTPGYPGNFAGSGGTNTLDLSGITIVTPNASDVYDVFVRGTDADDIYTGTEARDILNAPAETDFDYGGADQLFGMGGDDLLIGGLGSDMLDGGSGLDIAQFYGNRADFTVATTFDMDGFATGFTGTTDNDAIAAGDEGTDSLTSIESLQFADQTVTVDGQAQLFDSSAQFINSYGFLEAAVDSSTAGSDILLRSGDIDAEDAPLPPSGELPAANGQIAVTADLSITGQGSSGMGASTILASANTGNSGDARGMFLIDPGIQFDLSDLAIDGNGFLVFQAIRSRGSSTIDNVAFSNITYNESGPDYSGVAIAAFGTTGITDVSDSSFSNIGRIGVLYFGAGISGTFEDNDYTGKGDGDFLDYALDISAGATVTVRGNTISDNRGVASVDGSTSAGVLVSTFFAPGTTATIEDNTFTDNSTGIFVGFDANDTSTVNLLGTNTINSSHMGALGLVVVGNAVVTGVNASLAGNAAFVNWTGGDGDNNISGAYLADELYGNDGMDTINGWGGDDIIEGGMGNDTINGGDGNDDISGDEGMDIIDGGMGNDEISGGADADTINGGDGIDEINGDDGDDILMGDDGDDQLMGGDGNDTLDGGTGADFMLGGDGDDIYIVDNAGDAAIDFSNSGYDTVRSSITYTLLGNIERLELTGTANINGSGNGLDNVIVGNSGNNAIGAGAGDDLLEGGEGADALNGGHGADTATYANATAGVIVDMAMGGTGGEAMGDTFFAIEHLIGSAFDDSLTGDSLTNIINAGDGNDDVFGGGGNDRIFGEDGNDTLDGGIGNDLLSGGLGTDVFIGGAGADRHIGGAGTDTIDYSGASSAVVFDLTLNGVGGTVGDAAGDTYFGVERAVGSDFDDHITGATSTDILRGGDGNDYIYGGDGGYDSLFGDDGDDSFGYNTMTGGRDRINDYQAGVLGNETIYILGGDPNFDTFAEVMAAGMDDGNGNTVFDFGGPNRLTIIGRQLSDFDSFDFTFTAPPPGSPPPGNESLDMAMMEDMSDAELGVLDMDALI